MSESRIEPALPTKVWEGLAKWNNYAQFAAITIEGGNDYEIGATADRTAAGEDSAAAMESDDRKRLAAAIASCNAALPDSDPRKITREKIRLMKNEVHARNVAGVNTRDFPLMQFAWALESYLPPSAASSPEKP